MGKIDRELEFMNNIILTIVYFSTIFIVIEYIEWKHSDWATEQILSSAVIPTQLLIMWSVGSIAVIFSFFVMRRYQILFTNLKLYFLKGRKHFSKIIFTFTYSILILFFVILVLISTSVFFVGTGVSLTVIPENMIEDYSPILIVPLFILGITFITMILSEWLKYLDNLMLKYDSVNENLISEEE